LATRDRIVIDETDDEDPLGRTQRPWTRYDNLIKCAVYLIETMLKHDKDGAIPVIFFSSRIDHQVVTSPAELVQAFKNHPPNGSTNLLQALEMSFAKYAGPSESVLFVVFTDGQPDPGQPRPIKNLIRQRLTTADPTGNRLNVLFIRMGDDPSAIRFLQDLDDCQEIGDWVDTKADNDVYRLGPESLLINAIFENLEDA
jgi:hypothetical protein